MEVDDEYRELIQRWIENYLRDLEDGVPSTVVLTTDGKRHNQSVSPFPLPRRYLEEWFEATSDSWEDLTLDEDEDGEFSDS